MGFLVGIATALATSFHNAGLRKLSGVNPYLVNWLRFITAAVVSGLLVTFLSAWQAPPIAFWWLIAASIPIQTALSFWYVRAFQLSPQSLVGPLFSLSAVVLVPLGMVINGEFPSVLGMAGIMSAFFGSLVLGWDVRDPGVRTALTNIFRERGSRYMLGAAFAAGIAVALAKFAYNFAPPLVFAFWVTLALAVVHTPIVILRTLREFRGQRGSAIFMAGSFGVGEALNYVGIGLMLAAYFISLKRLSVVFDVVIGRIAGKEEHFRERFVGALLMIAGVILIALG